MVHEQGTTYLKKRSHRKSRKKIPAPFYSVVIHLGLWGPYDKNLLPVCGGDEASSPPSSCLSGVSSLLLALRAMLSMSRATELWMTWSEVLRRSESSGGCRSDREHRWPAHGAVIVPHQLHQKHRPLQAFFPSKKGGRGTTSCKQGK